MSVLFGISKKESVSVVEAFTIAASIVGIMSLLVLCIVRDPKLKLKAEHKPEELQ